MKSVDPRPSPSQETLLQALTPGQRGLLAAQAMAKTLEEEQKRWGLPLLTWKDGEVVELKS
ncbi:hypothetical protein [Haloferula sp. BvORR071]|uniref:hypothetical protein n=1 Tax=Haloferula sp. BvORR071 TaxID=1396141 RepID=UPI000552B969|nr:hypothetical protein [Haloferula sp. BvORR071]